MGGIKNRAAARQAPGGGRQRKEPGSWSWVGGAAAAACAKVTSRSNHGSADRRTRAMAAAGSESLPRDFPSLASWGPGPKVPYSLRLVL